MKILVIEDDSVSAMALRMLLEQEGHDVTVASDGRLGWQQLQQNYYPVAIVDWMMPGMDGVDVVRHLRASASKDYTCVIMLTAKQAREDRMEAMSAGADVFLTKPLNKADLLARLQVAERIRTMEQGNRNSALR